MSYITPAPPLKHGSLFNGIGGFQLAARWMGWQNVMSCEIDDWCNKVTKHHFPDCIQHGDIKQTDFTIYRGRIDILTGGFPCQPYSNAGKRLGKEDARHLWPEMLRAVREIQPGYVVGENVRGLTNWNGGLVFDEVQADLEAEGYEVLPFLLPACGVEAPHQRDRIWLVAYANGDGFRRDNRFGENRQASPDYQRSKDKRQRFRDEFGRNDATGIVTNTCQPGLSQSKFKELQGTRRRQKGGAITKLYSADDARQNTWQNFPTQSPVCSGNDGLPDRLDFNAVFEGIPKPRKPFAFGKWRKESIKAYGNAIVPQVAYEIFKAIGAIHAPP